MTQLDSELVSPMITPRFVPSCSRQLMTELGRLASERGLGVQTHLSENKPECEWVRELEPDCDNYTQVTKKGSIRIYLLAKVGGNYLFCEYRCI